MMVNADAHSKVRRVTFSFSVQLWWFFNLKLKRNFNLCFLVVKKLYGYGKYYSRDKGNQREWHCHYWYPQVTLKKKHLYLSDHKNPIVKQANKQYRFRWTAGLRKKISSHVFQGRDWVEYDFVKMRFPSQSQDSGRQPSF